MALMASIDSPVGADRNVVATHLCSLNSADTPIVTPSVQNPKLPFRPAVRVLRATVGIVLLPPLPPRGPLLPIEAVAAWTVTPVMLTLPPLQFPVTDSFRWTIGHPILTPHTQMVTGHSPNPFCHSFKPSCQESGF